MAEAWAERRRGLITRGRTTGAPQRKVQELLRRDAISVAAHMKSMVLPPEAIAQHKRIAGRLRYEVLSATHPNIETHLVIPNRW
jgi:hypothetical protein